MDGRDNSVKLWETVVNPAIRAERVRIAAATRRGQDLVSAVMYQSLAQNWTLEREIEEIERSNLDDEAKQVGKDRARFDYGVPTQ
jgi:hypothetical protein